MALLSVGTPAPSFKGQNLTGPEFVLDNVKGQKPIVLIFPPDQINPTQTSQTKTVYDKNRNDVEFVVMLRKAPGGSLMMVKAVLQQLGVKFPVVFDPKSEVYSLYGVDQPAVVYSIDKGGNIASALQFDSKALNVQQIEDAIAKAR